MRGAPRAGDPDGWRDAEDVGQTRLSTYPFDGLKLEAASVRDLYVNDRSRRIALHVPQLGYELDMQVCAEGVETERKRAILHEDGHDLLKAT